MPTFIAMSWNAGCSQCKTVCVIEVPMIKASMLLRQWALVLPPPASLFSI